MEIEIKELENFGRHLVIFKTDKGDYGLISTTKLPPSPSVILEQEGIIQHNSYFLGEDRADFEVEIAREIWDALLKHGYEKYKEPEDSDFYVNIDFTNEEKLFGKETAEKLKQFVVKIESTMSAQ